MRYLKNGAAKAIRTVRADRPDAAPTDRVVVLSPLQIQRRFTAAARAAGIEARLTAHSGRVGLASELTARGASTTEVMLAGNWKTARMVAHYSAGATAERGMEGSLERVRAGIVKVAQKLARLVRERLERDRGRSPGRGGPDHGWSR